MSIRSRTKAGDIRRGLVASGFSPLPLNGKAPVLKEWQSKLKTNDGEIQLWDSMYPNAVNTGILTKFTPAIDIDIIVPDAAASIEGLARETFGEHGDILVRFGNQPKRAVLLQTDEPFAKMARSFTAPDGSEQKIEILADGQQIVVAGIHPDIQRHYSWHGGEPWTTPREQLPYVREHDMQAFLEQASRVLIEDFGFVDKGGSKRKAKAMAPPWAANLSIVSIGANYLHASLPARAYTIASLLLPRASLVSACQSPPRSIGCKASWPQARRRGMRAGASAMTRSRAQCAVREKSTSRERHHTSRRGRGNITLANH